MLQMILIWTGAVLALGLFLVMALGPVIVELDARWHERGRASREPHAEHPVP